MSTGDGFEPPTRGFWIRTLQLSYPGIPASLSSQRDGVRVRLM